MGKPLAKQNSQIAVLLYPWFEFRLIHEFKAEDFFPKPAVKTILLEIKKREAPLIKPADKDKYFDFITYSFNRFKPYLMKGIPSKLNLNEWIYLFNTFLKTTARQQNLTQGVYAKQLKQQEHLKKIHRTRVDKNWRKC